VDSDEHSEDGHMTEDFEMRVKMMDKRMKKLVGMQKEVLPPIMGGAKDGKIAVVGWGSTKGVIDEAVEKSGNKNITSIHFKQVFPLPKNAAKLFAEFKKIIVVENNFTGQFANLLKIECVNVTDTVLKYTGEPFCVEELVENFKKL
jgi:2-oxoglutarate/2-oxoacid ferredoxin oxidoreductase subunit alpha